MKPLVSIIVPVYNREEVLERCLCSLKSQTYDNIEFLIINDGSTDHSAQILNKYATLDSRFHVIHKENEGVSATRNLGIQLATGEYIQFVDSDDWLSSHATQSLVDAIQHNCDMAICDYNRVVEKNIVVRGHMFVSGIITQEEFALQMMRAPANYYYGVLWNKLYRLDIIKENQIIFSEEWDWCEDFLFNLEYIKYIKNVYVLPEELYYYVRTKGSLSSIATDVKEIIKMKTSMFDYYKNLYDELDLYHDNKLYIRRFYIDFARDKVKKVKYIRGIDVKKTSRRISPRRLRRFKRKKD